MGHLSLLAQPVEFAGSFEQLQAAGKAQQKPYVVYFYGEAPCNACTQMESQTLKDPGIVKLLGSRFLWMKLNAESTDRQGFQLAALHRVSLYPTLLLFTPDGTLSKSLIGMQTPSMMRRELDQLLPAPSPPVAVVPPKPVVAPTPASASTRSRSQPHPGWWQVETKPLPSQGYGVQVGVYANYETILQELNRLTGAYNYPMAIRAETLRGKTVFKLVFGPFPDEERARQFKSRLDRGEGLRTVVILMSE